MSRLMIAVRRSPLAASLTDFAEEIAATAAFVLLLGSALAWLALLS